jgi:hypothetical protein
LKDLTDSLMGKEGSADASAWTISTVESYELPAFVV